MEITLIKKDKFQSLCKGVLEDFKWQAGFKDACNEFDKVTTFTKYQEIKDKIASLRNRKFYNNEIETLQKASIELNDILEKIKHEGDFEKLKKLYDDNDSEDSLVGRINEILGKPSSFPWAECNRIFIALHPEMFCAIPFEANVDKLIKLLKEKGYANVTSSEEDKWIDKAHDVFEFFKEAGFGYDGKTKATIPWQVFIRLGGMTDDYFDLLNNNHNLIITGAPGTGKTYMAKEIAAKMIGCELNALENNKQYNFVQFHPSYDYTDFVEGLRPTQSNTFERKDGIFKAFCAKAAKDGDKENKYVFIIDEINRGEISKIFGELFFSIDPGYRGEKGKVNTQYQNLISPIVKDEKGKDIESPDPFKDGFYVPENVYIIGTMNDIDRSVESMDFAFRRRFAFYEVTADDSKQMLWNSNSWGITGSGSLDKKIGDALSALDKKMTALNEEILDAKYGLSSAYQIGAAYFLKYKNYKDNEAPFESLWKFHLEGLLSEYLRGKPNAAELLKALKDVYDKAK